MSGLCEFIASFFFIGKFPYAPGSLGSFIALLLFPLFSSIPFYYLFFIFTLFFTVGVWTSGIYAKKIGKDDPSEVIIDEVVGMWFALLLSPKNFKYWFLSFFLFRFFDIVKPFPIRFLERKIKGGWGIMLDDIAASIYSIVVLRGIDKCLRL